MFKNISSKAIALGGISFAAAGVIGIGVEVTKAVTSEIQKARAATTAALAEMDKAKATMEQARAERLDAENKLLAAKEARDGTIIAAQALAKAQLDSSRENRAGLVEATSIDKYVENRIYDNITGQIIEPAKTIGDLNKKLARLRRELDSGVNAATRRFLTDAERADRLAQIRIIEEEKQIASDTSSANFNDFLQVMFKGAAGMMSGLETLNGPAVVPANRRFIVEEK